MILVHLALRMDSVLLSQSISILSCTIQPKERRFEHLQRVLAFQFIGL